MCVRLVIPFISVAFVLALGIVCLSDTIGPQEKAWLDFWYAQASGTTAWDIAYNWVNNNSNAVEGIFARTSLWDNAYVWVTQNSNGVANVLSRTSSWDTAYSWGDHATNNYLTDAPSDGNIYGRSNATWVVVAGGSPETDPVFTNWLATNTYVKVESDPIFTNWLATNAYVQTEVDPVFTNWLATNSYVQTEVDPVFTNWLATNSYVQVESDPVFTNWLAGANTQDWDTAYSWGDHATNGYITNYVETDPVWSAVSNLVTTQAANGQIAYTWGDHSTNGYITGGNTGNWDEAYSWVSSNSNALEDALSRTSNWDTAYGWGNHATNGYLVNNICELSLNEGVEQDFTAAAGYEVITNWQENICDAGYTTTHSNITVSAAGTYMIMAVFSFTADAGAKPHCHLYTNGVEAVDNAGSSIGWRRTVSINTYGSVTALGTLTLQAGDSLDWRLDNDGNDTFTWDKGTFTVEKR